MAGDRIAVITDFERQKLGAAVVLLSPFVPLLFMGDEYGETQPFPYFIDHSDAQLVEAVRQGRKEEFAAFAWKGEPPDPAAQATFHSARMRRPSSAPHSAMRKYYRRLLQVRGELDLATGAQQTRAVVSHDGQEAVTVVADDVAMVFGFADAPQTVSVEVPAGEWEKRLSSRDRCWDGPGDDIPVLLASDGTITMQLPGPVALLFARAR
jgi:maltooligosyltrehalose trehalohydrolase